MGFKSLFLLGLLVGVAAVAQDGQRSSILDDPDFLSDLRQVERPSQLGEPPCNCEPKQTPPTRGFIRNRASGFRCVQSQAVPGTTMADQLTSSDCATAQGQAPAGIRIMTDKSYPYYVTGPGISPSMNRTFRFMAEDGAREGSFFEIEDNILPADSHNFKSRLTLLPRKQIPSAVLQGSDLKVTLTTGEVVVFDAKTKKIKQGALTDGPVDTNTNRMARVPPSVKYAGKGISIRTDHRYEVASSARGDQTAEVRQGGRVCQVPTARVYDAEGKPLADTDAQMVTSLNQLCPPKAGEKPFTL